MQFRIGGHVATFADGPGEQAARLGAGHQRDDTQCTGGFPGDRDLLGIATEGCNVVLHPVQRGDLIEEAIVARQMLR